ncbi:DUF2797 domain-containing protein [Halobacteriales archaeon QS_7_69_60]|nr:MAG: DUF2797 domain-containing protein [Halobacteriales archaeon QS_7_69_60]
MGVSGDREAALLIASDGALERESLPPGRDLSYTLGERRCAGAVDGTDHHACEDPTAPYCEAHDSTWVCAKCTGTCLKAEMDCHTEHAVYLAAFAPETFKVGVTRRPRLETRLREQGADRGALLRLAGFDVAERFDLEYGLDLKRAPVAETLAAGTVRGTKGRVLVLERAGGTFAVDMRRLVGYELLEGSSSRELQSSLGAFG